MPKRTGWGNHGETAALRSVLPWEGPSKRRCPDCNGRGVIDVDGHREACTTCGGLNWYCGDLVGVVCAGSGWLEVEPQENEDASEH